LGWKVGQSVFMADLFKFIQPSSSIGYIPSLTLKAKLPLYHYPPLGPGGATMKDGERPFPLDSAAQPFWVRLADFELVCCGDPAVNVAVVAQA
jgi:hypothetical protein